MQTARSLALRAALVSATFVALFASFAACDSGPDKATCYSPSQNADKASQPGAVGCKCDPGTTYVCSPVAMSCEDGQWSAFVDGPCAPLPPTRDAGPDADARPPGADLDGSSDGDAAHDASSDSSPDGDADAAG